MASIKSAQAAQLLHCKSPQVESERRLRLIVLIAVGKKIGIYFMRVIKSCKLTVKAPAVGIDLKNEPRTLHIPKAIISCVASTIFPVAENKSI